MWKMNPMSGYDIRLCLLFQAYSLEREGEGNPHLFDIRPADDFTKQVCGMHNYLYAVRPSTVGLLAKFLICMC